MNRKKHKIDDIVKATMHLFENVIVPKSAIGTVAPLDGKEKRLCTIQRRIKKFLILLYKITETTTQAQLSICWLPQATGNSTQAVRKGKIMGFAPPLLCSPDGEEAHGGSGVWLNPIRARMKRKALQLTPTPHPHPRSPGWLYRSRTLFYPPGQK